MKTTSGTFSSSSIGSRAHGRVDDDVEVFSFVVVRRHHCRRYDRRRSRFYHTMEANLTYDDQNRRAVCQDPAAEISSLSSVVARAARRSSFCPSPFPRPKRKTFDSGVRRRRRRLFRPSMRGECRRRFKGAKTLFGWCLPSEKRGERTTTTLSLSLSLSRVPMSLSLSLFENKDRNATTINGDESSVSRSIGLNCVCARAKKKRERRFFWCVFSVVPFFGQRFGTEKKAQSKRII